MRKVLTYSSFVLASLVVVAVFFTAKTYTQLGIAVLIYPLFVYFAYQLFVRSNRKAPVAKLQLPSLKRQKKPPQEKVEPRSVEVVDIEKRTFLKLIGTAGIYFFLFSLLGRRAETFLFDRPQSQGDSSRDTALAGSSSPLDRYRISEIDDNEVSYYGFTSQDGSCFIMKVDPNSGAFRYFRADSDFPSNWARREKLNYDYFHKVF